MSEIENTNLINVATCYLRELKIPVTATSLKEQLRENPYFPSLYSISNVFDRFFIDHTAFKMEKKNLDKVTPPFLAYLSHQSTGKDFVLVTSVNEDEVKYISENRKPKKIAKQELLQNFQGIVLKAVPDENSGEKDFVIKHRKEIAKGNKLKLLIVCAAFIFFLTVFFFLHSLPPADIVYGFVVLVTKTIGVAATILLLIYQIDKSNAFVKSICTVGKQTKCNAVLGSKASKIFGITWSEAGFFYFAATFSFLLFPSINFSIKVFVLSFASCIVAPYILFSVYYQWRVVRQWCVLCLTVQAVLTAELIWSIFYFLKPSSVIVLPSAFTILSAGYYLLIPAILWFVLKPLILKAKDKNVYKAAYKRLLYNHETFNYLLQQQATAPDGYQNIGITIGNPAAENTIIKVCNPYCGPCAKAHPVLEEIIHKNKNVKLKLIFAASNDKDDERGIVARHLLEINEKQNSALTKALDDWYLPNKKDYSAFAAKYPMNGEILKQEKQIELMREWCKEAEITHTPTLFINGRRLPEKYKIEELQYVL